jgi:hypothetical protein
MSTNNTNGDGRLHENDLAHNDLAHNDLVHNDLVHNDLASNYPLEMFFVFDTDTGESAFEPRNFRNFYRPRYSLNALFNIVNLYASQYDDTIDDTYIDDIQHNSFLNDEDKSIPQISVDEIEHVLQNTPTISFADFKLMTDYESECSICYSTYDETSTIRHHVQCCNKKTCDECFRRLLQEKLECPYCIKHLLA